jgi:hypothetical protein
MLDFTKIVFTGLFFVVAIACTAGCSRLSRDPAG